MGRQGTPAPHLNNTVIPVFSMIIQTNDKPVAPKSSSIFLNSQKLEIEAIVYILL